MAEYSVYTGRWTDWSKGQVLGDQITLSTESSNVLIAAIAVLNALVSGAAWVLFSYTLHQVRANEGEHDGFYHQAQALLRNTSSPFRFAHDMLSGWFTWRKHYPRGALLQALLLAIPALTLMVAFMSAGLLLSKLSTTGEVLLHTTFCAGADRGSSSTSDPPNKLFAAEAAYSAQLLQDYTLSLSYAQACYPAHDQVLAANPASIQGANCDYYTKSSLTWNTLRPNKCPFSNLCTVPDEEVIALDTGLLDSNDDLGINAAPENRVQFRKVMTCSPITSEGFSTGGFVNTSRYGEAAIYYYGPNFYRRTFVPGGPEYLNQTFVYTQNDYDAHSRAYELMIASEGIPASGSAGVGPPSFNATDALRYKDASISLLFLANRAYYNAEKVEDPWFNATKLKTTNYDQDFYYSDNPVGVLACAEEFEFCNPTNGGCKQGSSQFSHNQLINFDGMGFNDLQAAVAGDLELILAEIDVGNTIEAFGGGWLAANEYLAEETQLVSVPLPSNQWQIEVQRLQGFIMSSLQRAQMRIVGGPTNKVLVPFYHVWENEEQKYLCRNQKFRSNSYQSFSVVGLALTFTFDGIVVLAAIFVAFILPRIQRRWGKKGKAGYRRRAWDMDSVLQLQRGFYRAVGHGAWEEPEDGNLHKVPTTRQAETFAALDQVEAIGGSGSKEILGRRNTANTFETDNTVVISPTSNSSIEKVDYIEEPKT